MSATFIDHHRRLATWVASLFLVGLLVVNGLMFFQQLNTANQSAPANPILSLPNGELLASDSPVTDNSWAWLPLTASIGGMIAFAVILGSFNLLMIKRAEQRDSQRRKDLQKLAEAFEAYYQSYGHYPISSSYQEGYYRALLITNEWKYYDLPADEVMRAYLPQWPLSDPSIHPKAKEQAGNYLYYPQHNGQYFSLYAVLERGKDEPATHQDGLGSEYDWYTYRVTSRRQPPAPQVATATEELHAPASEAWSARAAAEANSSLAEPLIETKPIAVNPPILASQELAMTPSPIAATEPMPVIQASTLPLDVRLAQGTASGVRSEPISAMLQRTFEPQLATTSLNQSLTSDTADSEVIGGAVQPRRQLAFDQTATTSSATAMPTAPNNQPSDSPLDDMPPLFLGGSDDLR